MTARSLGRLRLFAPVAFVVLGLICVFCTALSAQGVDRLRLPAPTDVQVSARDSMAAISWDGSATGRFDLEVSETPDFLDARKVEVAAEVGVVGDLKPSHTYYARVTAVTAGARGLPSQVVSFVTPDSEYPLSAPELKLTSDTTTSLDAEWAKVSLTAKYRVELSDSKDFDDPTAKTVSSADADFEKLKPATKYFARIRAEDAAGAPMSEWSEVVSGETLEDAPLRVASYNIRCKNCGPPSWASRRSAVAATVKGAAPDILGVQEASQARSTGPQFDQLLWSLGSPYKGTRQRISGATDGIIYNSDRVELIEQGSVALKKRDADRRLAWGLFRQKATGKVVLFASTHLEPDANAGALRVAQARQITSAIKSLKAKFGNPPVIVVGDFNTYPRKSGGNGAYTIMTSMLLDPIGQSSSPGVAKPEKSIRANYSSYNDFKRNPPRHGTYIDYIFVSPMRVAEWETVVNVDSSGRFIGTIPSDHNLIRADVYLPAEG